MDSIVKKSKDISAIVGFVDMDKKGNLYNAAAIIDNGSLKGIYHKTALPNYGVFDEKRYFSPGKETGTYQLSETIVGITICEDIWSNDKLCKKQANAGAKILINISASPYHSGKTQLREKMLKDRAIQSGSFVCYANLIGGQDELVFDGASRIFDREGRLIASGKKFAEDLVCSNLAISETTTIQKQLPKNKTKKLEDTEETYRALVLGTHDYVKKNGFQKVAIGLSGGIDSALTATIAADAIGKENVIGVFMPTRYSSDQTKSDAKQLALSLKIQFITIPINSIYDVYLITLSNRFRGMNRDATEENIQARIRANILMAFSNKFGWLILTTGNKSEMSVGYCTLYGDMAGGFSVIKDVFKTSVYKLAEFRNKKKAVP